MTDDEFEDFAGMFGGLIGPLNKHSRELLFTVVHPYKLESVTRILEKLSMDAGKYMKPAQAIGTLKKTLKARGKIDPWERPAAKAWYDQGVPVKVKHSSGQYLYGWMFRSGDDYRCVLYIRYGDGWTYLYSGPEKAIEVADGPPMPEPRQSLAVRLVCRSCPVPRPAKGDLDGVGATATVWMTDVHKALAAAPGGYKRNLDAWKHWQEEKRLGHPTEPRGMVGLYENEEKKDEPKDNVPF